MVGFAQQERKRMGGRTWWCLQPDKGLKEPFEGPDGDLGTWRGRRPAARSPSRRHGREKRKRTRGGEREKKRGLCRMDKRGPESRPVRMRSHQNLHGPVLVQSSGVSRPRCSGWTSTTYKLLVCFNLKYKIQSPTKRARFSLSRFQMWKSK